MAFSLQQKVISILLLATIVGMAVCLNRADIVDEKDHGRRPDKCSEDLAADLKLMWQTQDRASTDEAIKAAERVFATFELIGLTREQVNERLGDPQISCDSKYNFPFYPTGGGTLVYRFDNGRWGCQYNIRFGWNGKVRRVQYLMIE